MLLNHKDTVAGSSCAVTELWDAWLNGLPCQEDQTEGLRNLKALLRLVQRQEPEVLGEGGRHVPRILALLVDVYGSDTVDDETSEGIRRLMFNMGQGLRRSTAQFSSKQTKKLQRIMRENFCS